MSIPAGVERVLRVVGVDQVDPAGDRLDPVDDAEQILAAGVRVAGVQAEARRRTRRPRPTAGPARRTGGRRRCRRRRCSRSGPGSGEAAGLRRVREGLAPVVEADREVVALVDVAAVDDQPLGADRRRPPSAWLSSSLRLGMRIRLLSVATLTHVRRVDVDVDVGGAQRLGVRRAARAPSSPAGRRGRTARRRPRGAAAAASGSVGSTWAPMRMQASLRRRYDSRLRTPRRRHAGPTRRASPSPRRAARRLSEWIGQPAPYAGSPGAPNRPGEWCMSQSGHRYRSALLAATVIAGAPLLAGRGRGRRSRRRERPPDRLQRRRPARRELRRQAERRIGDGRRRGRTRARGQPHRAPGHAVAGRYGLAARSADRALGRGAVPPRAGVVGAQAPLRASPTRDRYGCRSFRSGPDACTRRSDSPPAPPAPVRTLGRPTRGTDSGAAAGSGASAGRHRRARARRGRAGRCRPAARRGARLRPRRPERRRGCPVGRPRGGRADRHRVTSGPRATRARAMRAPVTRAPAALRTWRPSRWRRSSRSARNGPIGLLALIATVCVLVCLLGAIRAILAQRASRAGIA